MISLKYNKKDEELSRVVIMEDPIKILKDFIAIRTDHPSPDYPSAIKFLHNLSKDLGFTTEIIDTVNGKQAILVYYYGSDSTLKPILLNCHIDVVKVDEEMWKYNPWSGEIDNNNIYGRGTQDMKSLGIMYLYAMYRMKKNNIKHKRSILVCFVPDEEIMSRDGMNVLVDMLPECEFCLDEGIPNNNERLTLYYGERKQWWLKLEAKGQAGHGSKFVDNHSVINLQKALGDIMKIYEAEKVKQYKNHLVICQETSLVKGRLSLACV